MILKLITKSSYVPYMSHIYFPYIPINHHISHIFSLYFQYIFNIFPIYFQYISHIFPTYFPYISHDSCAMVKGSFWGTYDSWTSSCETSLGESLGMKTPAIAGFPPDFLESNGLEVLMFLNSSGSSYFQIIISRSFPDISSGLSRYLACYFQIMSRFFRGFSMIFPMVFPYLVTWDPGEITNNC